MLKILFDMKKSQKRHFKNLFFIFLLAIPILGNSQNIFDSLHTEQYASYLYETQQYNLAISEYERLIFLSPNNENAKLQLIKSYRKNEQFDNGINKIDLFCANENFVMNNEFSHEYIKLLLLDNQDIKAAYFLQESNVFSEVEKQEYLLSIILLEGRYKKSAKFISDNNIETKYYKSLVEISNSAQNIRYKSPFMAMFLSSIIPGTGKVYTKDWKDGLISLFFIGINGYQSYRYFNKYGEKSILGWSFAGVSFGFYTGNIYGSFKSAKRYNNKLDNEIHKKVENTVFGNF